LEVHAKIYKLIKNSRILDLIFLGLLSIIVYHTWFKPGIIGVGDWVPWSRGAMLNLLSQPYGTSAYYIYPINLLHGVLSYVGLNYSVIERLIWYYPFVFLSFLSMYFLTYVLFKKRIICLFSSMIYAFNTYVGVIIGQMTLGMGYALAPLIIAFFIKGINERRIRDGIISGLLLSLSLSYDMRMAYLTSMVIILFIVFRFLISITRSKLLQDIRIFIGVTGCTFIIPIILHAFWVIPAIFAKQLPSVLQELGVPSSIMKEMNLYNGMFLLHIHRWGGSSIPFVWHILPAMVFISIIFHPKNRDIIFFTLLALIGIFLLKGIYPPHKEIYLWLFTHIPGFNAFREPSKFYMIIAMSYAPLFGVAVDTIANKIEKTKIIKVEFLKIAKFTFLILMLILIVFSLKPIITGQPNYILTVNEIPDKYIKIEKWHTQNPGRTLIYPENIHYVIGTISPQNSFFLKYLLDIGTIGPVYLNKTNHIGKIIGIMGIKYILLTPGLENKLFQTHRTDLPHYSPLQIMDRQLDLHKFIIDNNITGLQKNAY